ncbi:MAG: carbonic anhydrase [Simkaniaceae bacterium]|nr:carbonic anhydrase [Simkaniaceae bacterium]
MSKLLFSVLFSVHLFSMNSSDALKELMEGNTRFKKNKTECVEQNISKRLSLVGSQNPFAVIVACADSRVAPEIVFDQGIGDLFVVRVAGNVIGPLEMESIEYAVKHLGSSCVLVMGHQNCGAVNAAVTGQTEDVRYIAQLIKPSVVKAQASSPKNLLEASIKINAETMCNFVKQSSIVSEAISQNKLTVYPAYYNFDTGSVNLIN